MNSISISMVLVSGDTVVCEMVHGLVRFDALPSPFCCVQFYSLSNFGGGRRHSADYISRDFYFEHIHHPCPHSSPHSFLFRDFFFNVHELIHVHCIYLNNNTVRATTTATYTIPYHE